MNCNYTVDDTHGWKGEIERKTEQNKRQTVICSKGRCHKVTDYVKNTVKVFSGVCVCASAHPFLPMK